MSKAKLSQYASTWIEEKAPVGNSTKEKPTIKITESNNHVNLTNLTKKKQTLSLNPSTIKRLWIHRVKSGKNISLIIDELVSKHLQEHSL